MREEEGSGGWRTVQRHKGGRPIDDFAGLPRRPPHQGAFTGGRQPCIYGGFRTCNRKQKRAIKRVKWADELGFDLTSPRECPEASNAGFGWCASSSKGGMVTPCVEEERRGCPLLMMRRRRCSLRRSPPGEQIYRARGVSPIKRRSCSMDRHCLRAAPLLVQARGLSRRT